VGRKRKDGDPMGLAGTRLTFKRGKFWYRHRGKPERWEDMGTDLASAKRRATLFNDPGNAYGTVGYWLDRFVEAFRADVNAKLKSARTLSDYETACADGGPLKKWFGAMFPEHIEPKHVQAYLDRGAQLGRPVPANRERACLSSMLSWLLRSAECPPVFTVNPCMRGSGVQRNPEAKRERYVDDAEYRAVFECADRAVRLMMELTYRTLQRPESDILRWDRREVVKWRDGVRVLDFRQWKTGRRMLIAFSAELDALIPAESKVVRLHEPDPIVRTLQGKFYTYDGLSSMLKRAIAAANRKRQAAGGAKIASFGFRDLKGKGATDMWRAGVAIELIQLLCGHADKATTEVYVKARWRETVAPNTLKMGA
jgi:integrase